MLSLAVDLLSDKLTKTMQLYTQGEHCVTGHPHFVLLLLQAWKEVMEALDAVTRC